MLCGLLFLGIQSAKAQDYYHGIGGAANNAMFSIDYDSPFGSYSGLTGVAVPGAFYKATYTLNDQFAVSAYPFLGISLSANSRTGGSGTFGVELPVNGEVYFGDLDDQAFFAGAGFTYAFLASSEDGVGAVFGPQVAIGGQTYIQDHLLGARVAFTYGLNKEDLGPSYTIHSQSRSMITIGFYYSLDGY